MNCPSCDNPKLSKAKRQDYDYSKESGIAGCVLKKVKVRTCKACGFSFPDETQDQITEAITDVLLSKELLSRQDIKYIRTHFFTESYFEFGKRLKVSPTFLRELESLKKVLPVELSRKIQDEIIKERTTKVSISFEF
jgi:hypothetical protein